MLTENQVLTLVNNAAGATDLLEQLLERMPTAAERFAEEERRAWDGFAAADAIARPLATSADNAEQADAMLVMRRKRFPSPATSSPDGDAVAVQWSLLQAIVATGATEGQEGLWALLAQLGEAMK